MDDILLNKVAMIERCLKRIDEDYTGHEGELESDPIDFAFKIKRFLNGS
ncbi:MAG: hypothetical protein Q9M20_04045 [Mariprofundaceae bacterium]|nr:hypothetical protein [Mariprofundaceae bacterium]